MSEQTSSARASSLGYVGRTPGAARAAEDWAVPGKWESTPQEFLSPTCVPYPNSDRLRDGAAVMEALPTDGSATIWLTPPFNGKGTKAAVAAFISAWKSGKCKEAVVLLNNYTETNWFQELLHASSAQCFVARRIPFTPIGGSEKKSGSTRGQMYLYFGSRAREFVDTFCALGVCFDNKGYRRFPAPEPAAEDDQLALL